jgi:enoyl-CoA hydratase/carnithine racemase
MPAATFQRHDQLGEIVLDNPPLNLFSETLIADLRTAAEEASGTDVRAVLLRAEGDIFSGGADVSIFAGLDEAAAEALMTRAQSLIGAIEDLPVPTVALVHGRCFAGALEVALACDLIWAAQGTQIEQLEAIVGAFPFAGGTQRLASRIGAARAAEMVFGAGLYSAEELVTWGLITRVTPRRSPHRRRARVCLPARDRPDARAHGDQANSPRLALGRGVRSRSSDPDRGSARDPQPGSPGRHPESATRRPGPPRSPTVETALR